MFFTVQIYWEYLSIFVSNIHIQNFTLQDSISIMTVVIIIITIIIIIML